MARNITQLTLSSLTLALSLTGCGGRDLTLGTRDDGVNLDDDTGMTADGDGVGETGTGTGTGMVAVAGASSTGNATVSEPGSVGPAEAEDSSGSGGGAPAMGMGTPVAGAGPCTELRGGEIAYLNVDGEVVVVSPGASITVDGDGTTTVYHRDGTKTVIQPDGSQTTAPDAMIATAEDGTQTLYFSDGTVVTLLPNETVVASGGTWSEESWSIEGGPSGSSGTGLAPMEVPCAGMTGDPAPEDAFLRMCSANGDGTYTYVEADGTAVTVSRPNPLPDGTISMEEASSPCADVWAAEDADETAGDGGGMAMGGGSAVGGASGEAEPE